MQPIRRKIKLVVFLLAAAIAISTIIYVRGGFNFARQAEELTPRISKNFTGDSNTGKILFQDNCATCHSFDKEAAGPALLGVGERILSDSLMRNLLLYPKKAIEESSYLQVQYEKYGNTLHPPFLNVMSEKELHDVIVFVTKRGMF